MSGLDRFSLNRNCSAWGKFIWVRIINGLENILSHKLNWFISNIPLAIASSKNYHRVEFKTSPAQSKQKCGWSEWTTNRWSAGSNSSLSRTRTSCSFSFTVWSRRNKLGERLNYAIILKSTGQFVRLRLQICTKFGQVIFTWSLLLSRMDRK